MQKMVFWIDGSNKRRGWAKGPEEELEDIRERARAKLEDWIARTNEAIGEQEWSVDDFQEFIADVRETS